MESIATSGDELRDLYRELILDHARKPRHFGRLENPSHQAEGINPLCGDKLKIYLDIDSKNKITDVCFEGSGCAISVASASLLVETIIDFNTEQVAKYFSAIIASLTNSEKQAAIDLGKLKALEGVKEFPTRINCATLAWHTLNAAIKKQYRTVTTE